MTEELITETRIKLQNQSAQAQEILKDFYDEAHHDGYSRAVVTADDWITAEKVRDLWEEQK